MYDNAFWRFQVRHPILGVIAVIAALVAFSALIVFGIHAMVEPEYTNARLAACQDTGLTPEQCAFIVKHLR